MRSTCQKLKSQVPTVEVEESCASCASYNSWLRWPAKLTHEFSLLAEMWLFVLPLHSYYIYPYYPQKWWGAYWEKNSKRGFYNILTLLERELLILREKIFIVSSPSLSHCYTHWEEICTKTLPTPIQSVESVIGAWEALEDAKDGWCNMELIGGFGTLEKTWFGVTLLE